MSERKQNPYTRVPNKTNQFNQNKKAFQQECSEMGGCSLHHIIGTPSSKMYKAKQ